MNSEALAAFLDRIRKSHRQFQYVCQDLTDDQLAWIPSETAPPIRWHVWHVARATDLGTTLIASAAGLPASFDEAIS